MRTSKVREFNVRGSYANGYNKNVYTKRFSKPAKKFAGFGYAVETPPFTFTPPAGYKTVGMEQVTNTNQEEFAVASSEAGYNVPSIATAIPRGGVSYYAPPVGWWVAIVAAGEKESMLWISGDGNTVHGIDIDMSNAMAVGGKKPSSGLTTLLLLAAGGYVLYKLSQKNAAKPIAVKSNRRR